MMKPEKSRSIEQKDLSSAYPRMVILASSDQFYGIYGALSSDSQLNKTPAFNSFLLTVQLEI